MRLRRWSDAALAVAVVAGTLALLAPSAGAADAQGCSGSGVSFDDEGDQIDEASAPGPGGTHENPFDVTSDGIVRYQYDVNGPVAGGVVVIKLKTGIGDINATKPIKRNAKQSGRGVEPLKKHLRKKVPLFGEITPITGLVKVDVEVRGRGGGTVCVVSGWLKIHESVFTTPVFWVALIFVLLGILAAFWAMARPS